MSQREPGLHLHQTYIEFLEILRRALRLPSSTWDWEILDGRIGEEDFIHFLGENTGDVEGEWRGLGRTYQSLSR